MIALIGELRLVQFLIFPGDDDAGPFRLSGEFINLHANFGIGSHPPDLFPECRKNVDVIRFISDAHGYNVGLIFEGTSQPRKSGASQNVAAFLFFNFIDLHKCLPFDSVSDFQS